VNVFQFFITCKRTNNANNATHYVKLGKKRRESSKRDYYIISPRVIIKALIIIPFALIMLRMLKFSVLQFDVSVAFIKSNLDDNTLPVCLTNASWST